MIFYDGIIVGPNPEMPRTRQKSHTNSFPIRNSARVTALRFHQQLLPWSHQCPWVDIVFLLKFVLKHFDQSDIIFRTLRRCKRWIVVYQARMRSLRPPSSPACSLPPSKSMTLVSNDPSWWPLINVNIVSSYFAGSWEPATWRRWWLD
jgi:hypothetical protein